MSEGGSSTLHTLPFSPCKKKKKKHFLSPAGACQCIRPNPELSETESQPGMAQYSEDKKTGLSGARRGL